MKSLLLAVAASVAGLAIAPAMTHAAASAGDGKVLLESRFLAGLYTVTNDTRSECDRTITTAGRSVQAKIIETRFVRLHIGVGEAAPSGIKWIGLKFKEIRTETREGDSVKRYDSTGAREQQDAEIAARYAPLLNVQFNVKTGPGGKISARGYQAAFWAAVAKDNPQAASTIAAIVKTPVAGFIVDLLDDSSLKPGRVAVGDKWQHNREYKMESVGLVKEQVTQTFVALRGTESGGIAVLSATGFVDLEGGTASDGSRILPTRMTLSTEWLMNVEQGLIISVTAKTEGLMQSEKGDGAKLTKVAAKLTQIATRKVERMAAPGTTLSPAVPSPAQPSLAPAPAQPR